MRKIKSCITLFYCLIFVFVCKSQAPCPAGFSNYKFRKEIPITNSNASLLSDFQVKIQLNTSVLINSGDMTISGSDIRFVSSAGTSLPFWIDPDSFNSSNSDIWVKVDALAVGVTSIFMFHGNNGVSSVSSGTSTFDIFDDFSSPIIQSSVWETEGDSLINIQNGFLTLTTSSTSTSSSILYSKEFWSSSTNPVVVEYDMTSFSNGIAYLGMEDINGNGWGVSSYNTSSSPNLLFKTATTSNIAAPTDNDCRNISLTSASIPNSSDLTNIWSFSRVSSNDSYINIPTNSSTFYDAIITNSTNSSSFSNQHRLVVAAFYNSQNTNDCSFIIDWVRARKYAVDGSVTVNTSVATQELIDNVEASNGGSYCEGDDIHLFSPSYSGATYDWTGPNSFTSSLQNPIVINATALNTGGYTVRVNGPTCSPISATTLVVIDATTNGGTLTGDGSIVCSSSNSGILNLNSHVGDILYWEVANDVGGPWSSITSNSPSQSYNNLINDTYFRTIVKNESCSSDTSSVSYINVVSNTAGGNIIGSNEICSGENGDSLVLINFNGSIINWEESSDNGLSWSTIINSTDKYIYPPITNTLKFRVKVFNSPCPISYSDVATILVHPNPVASFNNDTVCQGLSTSFINNSTLSSGTISSYTWDFSNGVGSVVNNPVYLFPNDLNYPVTLSVTTSKGCSNSISKNVPVKSNPNSSFSQNDVCDTIAMGFQNNTSDPFNTNVYQWFFSDNSGLGSSNVSYDTLFTFSSAGSYDVSLVTTNANECKDSVTNQVTVYPRALISFQGDSVCLGQPITFINTSQTSSSLITYLWSFGDGSNSSLNSPTYNYSSSGDFYVTLSTISPGPTGTTGCIDTLQEKIVIYPTPIASFNVNNICKYDSVVFQNTTDTIIPNLNFTWNFDNGQFSNSYSPNHLYQSANSYTVGLNVSSDYGCSSNVSKNIEVYPIPTSNFTFSNECLGNAINFFNTSTSIYNLTYDWSFGDNSTNESTQDVSHFYPISDTFNVQLVISSVYNCLDTVNKSVFVFPKPNVNFTNTSACYGELTQFTDASTISSGTISNYLWNFDDLSNSIDQNPDHLYANEGTYNVSLSVVSDLNCSSDTSIIITVNPLPLADFTFYNACLNEVVDFSNSSYISDNSLLNYLWDFSDGNTSNLSDPQNSFSSFGIKSVKLIATSNNNCIDSISKYLEVFDLPTVNAGLDTVVSQGFPIQLFGYALGATDFSWTPISAINNNTIFNPVVTPLETTSYKLEITDVNGCKNIDSVTVTVLKDYKLFINNVITPDNNGENDTWIIKNIETFGSVNVYIYDRWGKEIFSQKGYQNDWDASTNYDQVPDGTYYYIINFDESETVYKGALTILRN